MKRISRVFYPRTVVGFAAVFLLSTALSTTHLSAQEPAARGKWDASWVTHPTAPLREPIVLHFKKSFAVTNPPAQFLIHVSADNRFVLYLNGERIGDGPARGDLAHWRYQTFDLAPHLKTGENILAATVWNFGVYAPTAQITNRTAFLVEGDTPAESLVNTGDSWLVEEEKGQIILPRKEEGFSVYMAAGPGETLDAKHFDWDWQAAGNPAKDRWLHAGPAIRENISPSVSIAASRYTTSDGGWELIPDTLPHMSYTLEDPGHVVRTDLVGEQQSVVQQFPQKPVTIPAHSHVRIMLDRTTLTTAYPRLTFSGGKDARIMLTYAEALYDKAQHKGNRNDVGDRQALGIQDQILPDGGSHRVFETLWWRTWRYLDLNIETADQPLTLDGMQAYFTAYPFSNLAEFSSSDPQLKQIWDIGWRTTQMVAHETYMDTPYYEQLQYAGDTRIELLTTYAVTGDDRLPRQAIRAFNSSRIPEGITQSRYPSSLPQYIPPFSLLWIGMVHDYWMYRPDTAFVQENLAGTRTVLDWFAHYQQPSGLLRRTPWWNFVDWAETKKDFPSFDAQGQSCLMTLQFIGALKEAGEMEEAIGDKEKAAHYQKLLGAAVHGVMSGCWDSQRHLLADSPLKDAFSQHTNTLAVLYDVIPKADQAAVMQRILAHDFGEDGASTDSALIEETYYFRFYLARAIDHAGMGDKYLKFLQPWRELLPLGFSTWPESTGETRSDSHAWSAHPTYDLFTIVAGIRPAEPGFKTVRITPHLGSLTALDASYPHPLGRIAAHYTLAAGKLGATIDLPPGLSGLIEWNSTTLPLHPGRNEVSLPMPR